MSSSCRQQIYKPLNTGYDRRRLMDPLLLRSCSVLWWARCTARANGHSSRARIPCRKAGACWCLNTEGACAIFTRVRRSYAPASSRHAHHVVARSTRSIWSPATVLPPREHAAHVSRQRRLHHAAGPPAANAPHAQTVHAAGTSGCHRRALGGRLRRCGLARVRWQRQAGHCVANPSARVHMCAVRLALPRPS